MSDEQQTQPAKRRRTAVSLTSDITPTKLASKARVKTRARVAALTEVNAHSKSQIKPQIKPMGATWWGHRWIGALEHTSRDVVASLGRGRAYARSGHVHDLQIKPGIVTALVSDDELENFAVSLKLEEFDAKTWNQIILNMHRQAFFVAQLLNGEMPREINNLFRTCGKSLFPVNSHDIDSDCGCDDWSNPCKHVAATHYVLGEALDSDPFLLFELRGRSKEQVLAALSNLRSAGNIATQAAVVESIASVALNALSPTAFEQGATALPALHFEFDTAVAAGALLTSLGKPNSWPLHETPAELLAPALAQAREYAHAIAGGTNFLPARITTNAKVTRNARPKKKPTRVT